MTTFAGRPVEGEISYYGNDPKDQLPIEEFIAALNAGLAVAEIEAVRWRAYTPYFNDGDPCVFGIRGAEAKFVADNQGGDSGDGWHEIYLGYPNGYWATHDHRGRYGKALPNDADRVWEL